MKRAPLVSAAALAVLSFLTLAPAVARADGVPITSATASEKEAATKHFVAGREAYTKKAWARALQEFKESLNIVASPNTRLYVARCLRELGQSTDAYNEYVLTENEGREAAKIDPKYVATADGAKTEREALTAKISVIQVQVNGGDILTQVRINGGPPKPPSSEQIAVAPGETTVVVETPGRPEARTQVKLAAGETRTITMDVPRPGAAADAPPIVISSSSSSTKPAAGTSAPKPAAAQPATPIVVSSSGKPSSGSAAIIVSSSGTAKPGAVAYTKTPAPTKGAPPPSSAPKKSPRSSDDHPLRPWAIASTVIGAGGMFTFGVAGLLARSTYNSLKSDCLDVSPCPTNHDEDVSRGDTQQTIANVGLGIGIAGLAVGGTLFIIDLSKKPSSKEAAGNKRELQLVGQPGGLSLKGSL